MGHPRQGRSCFPTSPRYSSSPGWEGGIVLGVQRDWAVEMGSREMEVQKWGTERWDTEVRDKKMGVREVGGSERGGHIYGARRLGSKEMNPHI